MWDSGGGSKVEIVGVMARFVSNFEKKTPSTHLRWGWGKMIFGVGWVTPTPPGLHSYDSVVTNTQMGRTDVSRYFGPNPSRPNFHFE